MGTATVEGGWIGGGWIIVAQAKVDVLFAVEGCKIVPGKETYLLHDDGKVGFHQVFKKLDDFCETEGSQVVAQLAWNQVQAVRTEVDGEFLVHIFFPLGSSLVDAPSRVGLVELCGCFGGSCKMVEECLYRIERCLQV